MTGTVKKASQLQVSEGLGHWQGEEHSQEQFTKELVCGDENQRVDSRPELSLGVKS